jgi:hypothetical protein
MERDGYACWTSHAWPLPDRNEVAARRRRERLRHGGERNGPPLAGLTPDGARRVTPTQTRDFHHLQLTDTAGAQFSLTPQLKLRGGAGVQRELLAPEAEGGGWHAVLEAGATLDPTAIATFGALAVKLEGLVDYDLIAPTETRQHQLRATGKLSVPLVPALFLTVGLDVFAAQRQREGWGASYDTTIGLRVHTDFAHQPL